MAKASQTVNKQTLYITIFIVFIAGFLSGVGFAVFKLDDSSSTASQNQPGQTNVGDQERQAIINLEARVTSNPEDFNAWTKLGHLYFDSDQYNKAIGAYTKSLELHPGDANLWTDLGVMYRRSGDSTKAIESFDKAIAMNPVHEPSRLNKGIVLFYDFGKVEEAIAIWEAVLKLNPESRTANGMKLQDFLEQIKEEQNNS
ncbi:MAG: tetratricopeptide repeat protein [Desulfobulbaceae bacterium]|nr:MAG: tetratricopeptide repeat protein [Desulfobulbaceae bacterium]